MKSKIVSIYIPVILLIGLVVSVYGKQVSAADVGKEKIKFGFGLPLSGFMAPGAVGELNAYLLWADDVNAEGGIYVKDIGKKLPVELVYYDDKSSPEETIKIYERLITVDKVDLLLSPYSEYGHMAVLSMVERHGIPLIGNTCGTMAMKKLKNIKYFWYVSALPDRVMPVTVDMLVANKSEIKSVAILYIHDPFTVDNYKFLKVGLKEKGFDVVIDKDYPLGVSDLSPQLLEIKAKQPDALLFLSYPGDAMLIMRQMMDIGLDAKLIYILLGPATAVFPKTYGQTIEGITFFADAAWCKKGPGPGSAEFHKRFIDRFGGIDYENSSLTYVSCQVLKQAIEKAGTLDWKKIRDTIATEEFTTLFGTFHFDGIEKSPATPGVRQWQKGEVEMVWPPDIATAPLEIPKPPWP